MAESTLFNVSGFTSTIKTLGLASPNKFKVDIAFPALLSTGGAHPLKQDVATLRNLSLMC